MTPPHFAVSLVLGFLVLTVPFYSAALQGEETVIWEPIQFRAGEETVGAEHGTITVPENRSNPRSRRIKLTFVRFKSTAENPGSPIVYPAGGPGGSGVATARGRRFPLFMALREVADVIAFDQRGTGGSNDIPPYDTGIEFPMDREASREDAVKYYRAGIAKALDFWKKKGIDIAGYTTAESILDLYDLKQALGAKKISLWGYQLRDAPGPGRFEDGSRLDRQGDHGQRRRA